MTKDVFTIHTDGGARGNPGPAAIGIVIKKGDILIHEFGKTIGSTTNNVAEYMGVIEALIYIKSVPKLQNQEYHFFLDSLLIVNQINGIFKIKETHLKELYLKEKILEQEVGGEIFFSAIPREQNKRADQLVNNALDNTTR